MTFAIEKDYSVCLELEIGTDLGCTVRGLVRRSPVGRSKGGAGAHPAFQRLSDLLRSSSKSISYDTGAQKLRRCTVLMTYMISVIQIRSSRYTHS